MKTILYDFQKKSWGFSEVQKPSPNTGEALVKVTHAGLCGSDMHRIDAPSHLQEKYALGHEITGIVTDALSNPSLNNKIVVVNPIVNCGACAPCVDLKTQFCKNAIGIGKTANGGFSEYITVPTTHLYPIPSGMNPKLGVLTDGVAVIIHALSKLNSHSPETALIIGDGTVAALTAAALKIKHPDCKVSVSGRNQKNLALLATKYGVYPYNKGDSFDISLETVGRSQSETLNFAIQKANIGGQILVLGVYPESFPLNVDARTAFYKELSIDGINSFVSSTERNDFREALDLIAQNQDVFDGLITHELPLGSFLEGVELMKRKAESGAIKVLFQP